MLVVWGFPLLYDFSIGFCNCSDSGIYFFFALLKYHEQSKKIFFNLKELLFYFKTKFETVSRGWENDNKHRHPERVYTELFVILITLTGTVMNSFFFQHCVPSPCYCDILITEIEMESNWMFLLNSILSLDNLVLIYIIYITGQEKSWDWSGSNSITVCSLSSKSSGRKCSVIFRYKSIRHVWHTGDDKK